MLNKERQEQAEENEDEDGHVEEAEGVEPCAPPLSRARKGSSLISVVSPELTVTIDHIDLDHSVSVMAYCFEHFRAGKHIDRRETK